MIREYIIHYQYRSLGSVNYIDFEYTFYGTAEELQEKIDYMNIRDLKVISCKEVERCSTTKILYYRDKKQ